MWSLRFRLRVDLLKNAPIPHKPETLLFAGRTLLAHKIHRLTSLEMPRSTFHTISHSLRRPLARGLSAPYHSSSDQLVDASCPSGPTTTKRNGSTTTKRKSPTTTKRKSPTTTKRKSPTMTKAKSPPKRTPVDGSRVILNGNPRHFQSGHADFRTILMQNDQVYFDRTRYISVLENFSKVILFCRPRRFGKSLTINTLEHFHGLQYADEHQTLYQVCDYTLDYLDIENLLLFQSL
jgi:hypothetical protein